MSPFGFERCLIETLWLKPARCPSEERLTSLNPALLGEGVAEEGEHAVAGEVRERGEFEGIVAAVKT